MDIRAEGAAYEGSKQEHAGTGRIEGRLASAPVLQVVGLES